MNPNFSIKKNSKFLIGPHEKKWPPTYGDFDPKFPKVHLKRAKFQEICGTFFVHAKLI